MPLVFATIFTLSSLTIMLLGIVIMTFLYSTEGGGGVNLYFSLGIVIVINFIFWLIGPFFVDLLQRFTYKIKQITFDELENKHPKSAQIIKQVTDKYGYKIPILKIIEDQNPTAYTYGSGRYNARIVLSEGLFHYLTEEEVATVVAHELGHITRRDFIVMSVASTLLQSLYTIYLFLARTKGKGNSKSGLAQIGQVAYIFYFIGQYILLYLSRAREYGADEFAIKETKNPNGLSSALLKISYGIAIETKKKDDNGLIKGTQALGISNLKSADQISSLSQAQDENNFNLPSLEILSRILAFDFVSVWAKISEFFSTHPLTGKRIRRINSFCQELNQQPFIDFTLIENQIDQHKKDAHSAFFKDLFVWIFPFFGIIILIISMIVLIQNDSFIWAWYGAVAGICVFFFGGIWKIKYKYPTINENSADKGYLALMQDFTASPIRGKPAIMEGSAVGKGVSGSYFSEDFLLGTSSGIVFCNYQSIIPFFGNLFAAFGKIKKLIENKCKVQVTGWFFRKNTQWLDLSKVYPDQNIMQNFSSHPIFGSVIKHIFMTLILIAILTYPLWFDLLEKEII